MGMKKVIIFITLLAVSFLTFTHAEAKSRIIPAGGRFDTRFLIVVDKESYNATQKEITEYKKAIEADGLGVVILIGEWNNPVVLREEIRAIYNKRPPMEGAVFIGKIPVVRVRNFQHATTAFKMDEENFPMFESSVTSDRFYDDMDLEFEFIKQDEKNPLHFYYNLKESSPQQISSEFYSARILPPSDYGVNEHELIAKFLLKAAAAHREVNYADNIIFFNGHGYNSDCLTVWQNQQFAIKEQFPLAFKDSRGNAFYNFRQDPFMKFKLYERMQKEGTDLFVFHEHGDYDTQYINGEFPAPNALGFIPGRTQTPVPAAQSFIPRGPVEAALASVRNMFRRYKGERAESFRKSMIEEYGFGAEIFDQKSLDETKYQDSLFGAHINIKLPDLKPLNFQPRVTIFDACYNASFHRPGYVAGYHIFGEGNTVVTQGNTVNVLQDKWSMELVGMLAQGARVGFWQKEIQTLESHLVGDPTFRFTAGSGESATAKAGKNLNRDLAVSTRDTKVWMEYFKSDNPNLQAIALKLLAKNPHPGFSDLLIKTFRESKSYIVRMQALKRMIDRNDKYLAEALVLALDDSYELIRRNAARFSGYSGDSRLIKPLVHTLLFSQESQRVQYAAQIALEMFDLNLLINEVKRQAGESNLIRGSKTQEQIISYYTAQNRRWENSLAVTKDKSAETAKRVSAIRGLRNYNNHAQVEELLSVLTDNTDDIKVRITLAEALGWFNWSIKKGTIIDTLNKMLNDGTTPEELRGEVLQSIKRLSVG